MKNAQCRTGSWPRRRGLVAWAAAAMAFSMPSADAQQRAPYEATQRETVGEGFGRTAAPQGLVFVPRLEVAAQYAHNFDLSETTGTQLNAFGLEVAPGAYASYRSPVFMGALDYALVARGWDESDYNDISHRLAANGRWTAVSDLLYLDGRASYDDVVIDAAQTLNYGNIGIFGQSNLAERASAALAPTLFKRFNNFNLETGYSYGRVWYLNPGKGQDTTTNDVIDNDDSRDQSARFAFGTNDDPRKLNWSVAYNWDRSDFRRAVPYEFERAGLDLSWQLGLALRLLADVGKESALDESTTQGGLDSDFWNAGLRWSPGRMTSVEARFGDRFFGRTYSGNISHRSRLLEVTASYSEEPNVQTRGISLGTFDPGTLPPGGDPGIDSGRLNAQPAVFKISRVKIAARGSRTTVALQAFNMNLDYLRPGFEDERSKGASVAASRRFASNFSVDASANYSDFVRSAGLVETNPFASSHVYDTQLLLRANREFGPKVTSSLEAGYFNRSGTTTYDGWWIGLRGLWTPGKR